MTYRKFTAILMMNRADSIGWKLWQIVTLCPSTATYSRTSSKTKNHTGISKLLIGIQILDLLVYIPFSFVRYVLFKFCNACIIYFSFLALRSIFSRSEASLSRSMVENDTLSTSDFSNFVPQVLQIYRPLEFYQIPQSYLEIWKYKCSDLKPILFKVHTISILYKEN